MTRPLAIAVAGFATLFATAHPAAAEPGLYVLHVPVHTAKSCPLFAKKAIAGEGISNWFEQGQHIVARTQTIHLLISCVSTKPRQTAIISLAFEGNKTPAKTMLDNLAKRIVTYKQLD